MVKPRGNWESTRVGCHVSRPGGLPRVIDGRGPSVRHTKLAKKGVRQRYYLFLRMSILNLRVTVWELVFFVARSPPEISSSAPRLKFTCRWKVHDHDVDEERGGMKRRVLVSSYALLLVMNLYEQIIDDYVVVELIRKSSYPRRSKSGHS